MFTNVMLAAAITGSGGIVFIFVMLQAARNQPVPPEMQGMKRPQTTWYQDFGFFITCVIPAILLSWSNEGTLTELVKFQLGVVLNFYIFAAFSKMQWGAFLNLRYIRQHPELETWQVLEAMAISSMKNALGGVLTLFILIGIFGGGIYGMGIALAGVIFGAVWITIFINEDFHKSKIVLWKLMTKQRSL